MKKLLYLALILVLLIGCAPAKKPESSKLRVLCAGFAEYDWMREICAGTDAAELTLLIQNGSDPHSYQPTVADIAALEECDLLVYNGSAAADWIRSAAQNAKKPPESTLRLMDLLSHRLREEAEELQAEEEDSAEGAETDEHIWLSLKNAVLCVTAMSERMAKLDSDNADTYTANALNYIARLDELDVRYADMVAGAQYREVLVADRFPFLYLLEDYGIAHLAAFPGCSAETQASFNTVIALTEKLNASRVPAVLVMDASDRSVAKAVVRGSDCPDTPVLALNSLQSVGGAALAGGITYLGVMEENLGVLAQALGGA